MKTAFLVAGVVLSVVSLVVLGLTSFVPDFVVAIYNGADDKSCQVANVGAYTSEWTPECSREIDPEGKGVKGVPFSSPTTEFWPLFPLMNPQAEGNPLNGVLADFETCEKSLTQLDAVVVATVSSLTNATADSIGESEAYVEGALWQALSPLQNVVAGNESTYALTNTMSAAGPVGLQLSVHAAIFAQAVNASAAGVPSQLGEQRLQSPEFVAGVVAGVVEQVGQVLTVTSPCFCSAVLDDLYVDQAVAFIQATPPNEALGKAVGALTLWGVIDEVVASVINPCTAQTAGARALLGFTAEDKLASDTALDICFEKFALNIVARTQYQSVFNTVDGINRTEALRQCENDIKDIEALELAQTLLTVAVAVGGLAIVVGVVALVMQSVTALSIVALFLSVLGAGVTMFALLTVKGAPVYESVGLLGCVTCYEASSGTSLGYAAVGLPVVAGLCYGISLMFKAGEASEDEQGLVASNE